MKGTKPAWNAGLMSGKGSTGKGPVHTLHAGALGGKGTIHAWNAGTMTGKGAIGKGYRPVTSHAFLGMQGLVQGRGPSLYNAGKPMRGYR